MRWFFVSTLMLLPSVAVAQPTRGGPLPDPLDEGGWTVLAESFAYEQRDLRVRPVVFCTAVGRCSATEDRGDYVREKFVFEGRKGAQVPGYLALPSGVDGPQPIVILLYGLNGTMEDWWDRDSPFHVLTDSLLRSGFGVLTLEQPYHGLRKYEIGFSDAPSLNVSGRILPLREMSIQAIVELRQAIDYLSARPDVDPSRIGSVGFSMGALHSLFLAAVEPRLETVVSWATPMRRNDPLFYPGNFALRIKAASVLLLGGEQDPFYTPEEAATLFDLIPAPDKSLEMFDGAHQMRPGEVSIVVEWLRDRMRTSGVEDASGGVG